MQAGNSSTGLVERLRPLIATRSFGQQLFVIALLESRSADRYREWARSCEQPDVARGFAECAAREDQIAARIQRDFARIIEQPPDLAALAEVVQREVASIFAGKSREQQYALQASAERAGRGVWEEFAAGSDDAAVRETFMACAALEVGSAEFLESLARR